MINIIPNHNVNRTTATVTTSQTLPESASSAESLSSSSTQTQRERQLSGPLGEEYTDSNNNSSSSRRSCPIPVNEQQPPSHVTPSLLITGTLSNTVTDIPPLTSTTDISINNNNSNNGNSNSSSTSSSSSNRDKRNTHSLSSEFMRFFRGTTSLLSSNSPSRSHQREESEAHSHSPQAHSRHQQHQQSTSNTTRRNNNNNSTTTTTTTNNNANSATVSNPASRVTHSHTASTQHRQSKYPMALPTEIDQVYDGPVRGTAIIDSSYILDSSPVFEMITATSSTSKLKRKLNEDVRTKENSMSLSSNSNIITNNASASHNNGSNNLSSTHSFCNENNADTPKCSKDNNCSNTNDIKNNLISSEINSSELSFEEMMEEEDNKPIMIEADNTGRLRRSNSSDLSKHGSFSEMKLNNSNNNNSSSSRINNDSFRSSNNNGSSNALLMSTSLPNMTRTSKNGETTISWKKNNNFVNVPALSQREQKERCNSATITTNNKSNNESNDDTSLNADSREEAQTSHSLQKHDETNVFSLHHNNNNHHEELQNEKNVSEQTSRKHEGSYATKSNATKEKLNNNVANTVQKSASQNQQHSQRQELEELQYHQEHNDNLQTQNAVYTSNAQNASEISNESGNNRNSNSHTTANRTGTTATEVAADTNTIDGIMEVLHNSDDRRNTEEDSNASTNNSAERSGPQRSEPLNVLNGDFVLFSDSFVESDPSSIVAVVTEQLRQTCMRCSTMTNKTSNLERTRLQAVREVLAEAEVECRPLFRRVPSELVYGTAEYLPEDENKEAQRSIHDVIENYEEPYVDEDKKDNVCSNEEHQKEEVNNIKATTSKNMYYASKQTGKQNLVKTKKHTKDNNNINNNNNKNNSNSKIASNNITEVRTIRQVTEELQLNTPRVWNDSLNDDSGEENSRLDDKQE